MMKVQLTDGEANIPSAWGCHGNDIQNTHNMKKNVKEKEKMKIFM